MTKTHLFGRCFNPRLLGFIPVFLTVVGVSTPVAKAVSEVVLHSFSAPPKGAVPYAGVIRDSKGNLYGTATSGGAHNAGVVFKVNSTGRLSVLYNFTGGADGRQPQAGVVRDSAGNLYGTTYYGGNSGYGTVYKLDSTGHETVLHHFTAGVDGGLPSAGVILDSSGNLYGTASYGGTSGNGVVYKVDTTGHQTVLHSFAGGTDGRGPQAGLVRDSAGNLYGTAGGGSASRGVVYKLDSTGNESVIYTFTGGSDGGGPSGGLTRDAAGNLYGTAVYGGTGNGGVVFKIDTTGQETVLYNFTGSTDGASPEGGVIRDSAGNLYGVAQVSSTLQSGVVYKVDKTGVQTVLHTFTGKADGRYPLGALVRDSAGNLYGTTSAGGTAQLGVVFKVTAAGVQTVLDSFQGPADGMGPTSTPILDFAGNMYGTTPQGGPANAGVVYKITAAGAESVLYSFKGGTDGVAPQSGVCLDAAGNLYGTTASGGTSSAGVVYKLTPAGHETVLHSFAGGADGRFPYGNLVRDANGNLYGTTESGGQWGSGTVFKLDAAGNYSVLYAFTGQLDGAYPYAGLTLDAGGNLYGTAYSGGLWNAGVVYKIDPGGNYSVLYTFTYNSNTAGDYPYAGVFDASGTLYGSTQQGGTNGAGLVYKVDTAGQYTVLYNLTGGSDGRTPNGITADGSGNAYGTTNYGGGAGSGVVFKLDPAGNDTVLYSFTGGTDGGLPAAGMVFDGSGNLVGTASAGGTHAAGVVLTVKGPF